MKKSSLQPQQISVNVISPVVQDNVRRGGGGGEAFFYNSVVQPKQPVTRGRRQLKLIISIIFALCLSAIVVVIIIFGAMPCSFTKCHSRASMCINRPFYAQCVCDWGYSGNGRTYCDDCGLTFKTPNVARIIGGIEARPNSWPFGLLVKQSYTTKVNFDGKVFILSTTFLCGGTLINRKTLVTAAHCITTEFDYDYEGESYKVEVLLNEYHPTWESMFKVYVGMHSNSLDLNTTNSPDARELSVAKVIKNGEYEDANVLNDIAILKLNDVVKLTEDIQVACLPRKTSSSYPPSSTQAYIIGWGSTETGGESSSVLRNVKIQVYEAEKCKKVSFEKIWDAQICAGDYDGGKDSCQGDSGGGLFVTEMINNRSRYILSGVVSYGDDCALPQYPGIYTRTSYYLDWIIRNSDF